MLKLFAETVDQEPAHVSWWPSPHSWLVSGLCTGYWSSKAETWFQTRLEAIRKGEQGPRRAIDFRNMLKYARPQLASVGKSNTSFAHKILDRVAPPPSLVPGSSTTVVL